MRAVHHKELAAGRWFTFSLAEQLAHVGSEVSRTISARARGDTDSGRRAFKRMLELLDLTIADLRWRKRLKELTRLREVLCDYFVGDNQYRATAESLNNYFLAFTYAARRKSMHAHSS